MEKIKAITEAMIACDTKKAVKAFIVEHDDTLTNAVRETLDSLPEEQIERIKGFLNHLLNACYDYQLYEDEEKEDDSLIKELDESALFLFKETIIYFLGRLKSLPDITVLKKAYYLDENKYIKLNLVFASLPTYDEEIEMDFASKTTPGSEYDNMLRSWTMAFFTHADKPYEHVDTKDDDWTAAKQPRIKRLSVNDETNPKFNKAMAFRLMDFLVIYLFLENRKTEDLTSEEKRIIEDAFITYSKYSQAKQAKLQEYKELILKNKNYS